MARSSATWKPGIPSPNPTGKATLAERVAARTIAESFRELADPVDIGRSLLAIYAGVDPFAKKGDAEPGGPSFQPVPLDMTHRMAALKMYLEYGYGKPLQGVVIDAQVRQQTTIREERTAVVELRELASKDPAAREALRTIARAMLGAPALQVDSGNAQSVGGPADSRDRGVVRSETDAELAVEASVSRARTPEAPALEISEVSTRGLADAREPAEFFDGDDLEPDDALTVGEEDARGDIGDLHASMLSQLDEVVNEEEKKPARVPGVTL